ncbi:MAG: 5-deoxy-glucuronate isomerase [Chloroflexota bacterium]|nr:5-deoxy-glucuronate isomerase [Chloroflexota bacterium]
MRQYDERTLVVHPQSQDDPDVIVSVTRQQAGWDTIDFQVRKLTKAQSWQGASNDQETALVMLSGTISVKSDQGSWDSIGERKDVFSGLPYALYLPVGTHYTVTADTDCEFAIATAPASQKFPAKLITPQDVHVEVRGGDHATRQINDIIPPGFASEKLVVVEVYTPSGNWSSYPPHKHDNRQVDADGKLLQADLDEIYYYKIDRPEGYALQRVYTGQDSPLAVAGKGFDAALVLHNNDIALVPEGFHPVSSPPGYTTYYLNILAGSDQVLTASDDPDFTWVKDSYTSVDPRLPIYPVK